MKFRTAIAALALFAAGTAEAGLIRWTYVEESLLFTDIWIDPEIVPFDIPVAAGPVVFSFELDPADFPDFGHAPVVLRESGPISEFELFYSIQNITVTANASPALFEIWEFLLPMKIEIGTDGAVSAWEVAMEPGMGRNSTLFFSDEVDTRLSFFRMFPTDTTAIVYGGSGGSWTRTGGEAIFPAPVPLPASVVLLAGGLAGLHLLPRRSA